jgi:hypothetical protein
MREMGWSTVRNRNDGEDARSRRMEGENKANDEGTGNSAGRYSRPAKACSLNDLIS